MMIAVGALFGIHLFVMSRGITTIEYLERARSSVRRHCTFDSYCLHMCLTVCWVDSCLCDVCRWIWECTIAVT